MLCFDVLVEIFCLFVLVFILIGNERHIRCVFDFPMGVMNIFDGDGV